MYLGHESFIFFSLSVEFKIDEFKIKMKRYTVLPQLTNATYNIRIAGKKSLCRFF